MISYYTIGQKVGTSSTSSPTKKSKKNELVLSGGEGYIDFRLEEAEEMEDPKHERSNLIVWQVFHST